MRALCRCQAGTATSEPWTGGSTGRVGGPRQEAGRWPTGPWRGPAAGAGPNHNHAAQARSPPKSCLIGKGISGCCRSDTDQRPAPLGAEAAASTPGLLNLSCSSPPGFCWVELLAGAFVCFDLAKTLPGLAFEARRLNRLHRLKVGRARIDLDTVDQHRQPNVLQARSLLRHIGAGEFIATLFQHLRQQSCSVIWLSRVGWVAS